MIDLASSGDPVLCEAMKAYKRTSESAVLTDDPAEAMLVELVNLANLRYQTHLLRDARRGPPERTPRQFELDMQAVDSSHRILQ